MARISFRQGIVRHGKSPGQPFFLQQNGQFVDLVVSPDLTLIAFADGNKDYLYTESVTAIKAWGPFAVPDNYWMYWDINRVTGIRTYGSTTLLPIYATTAPLAPIVGQMWFDVSTGNATSGKMYEYNGASWVQVLRVFAGIYSSSNQFLSPVDTVSIETNFTGTQIGATGNVTTNAGALAYDAAGKPIVNQDGKFFTTEDVFTAGVPTGASLKINNSLIRAQSTESIGSYQVVVFSNFNKIALASPFDFLDKVYGIVEEDVPINDIGNVVTEGVIFNELWDFVNSTATPPMVGSINDPIYVTSSGELTTDITFSIPGQVPVGAIVGLQSILFSPGIYGTGASGPVAVDHGSLTGLGDDDHPQYFNQVRGDARYYERTIADSIFAPIVHTHTKSDITDFTHTHVEADITDLDKYTQAQVDSLLDSKVSLDGSLFMTGALRLPSDPTNALEAATKQYVDAVAAGIDAKDSVAVATTFDITATGSPSAVYNPAGGTGGTGEFTNVDITNLDGVLNTDYNFNLTNRVLIKNQTDATQNGIYIISNFGGSPYTSATLERAADHDGTPQSEVSPGNYTFVSGGLTHAGSGWVVLAGTASGINDTIILNTDDMNWAEVSSSTSFTPGSNIDISSGNVISVIQASAGGTVDALTWNSQGITVTTGSPGIQEDEVLLYKTATSDWRNSYLSFIRNTDNTSNVTINTVNGDVDLLSSGAIDLRRDVNNFINLNGSGITTLTSQGATNITASGAISLSSTGNTTFTAGTSSILLNNTSDVTITSAAGVVVSTPSGQGTIKLVDGTFNTSLEVPAGLAASTLFRFPPNNGTVNQILETDGTGVTSWVDPPSGGGGSAYCLQDTDGDTFVAVGFGGSPICTDTGSNVIQIQAGDAQLFGDGYGGAINIISGRAYPGNGYSAGNISITVPDALNTGTNAGGNITLQSGAGYGDDSGGINLYGANATSTGSNGGNIIIKAGDGPDAYNSSGNVTITAGSFPGGGESSGYNTGDVHIQTQNPGAQRSSARTAGHIYLEPGVNYAGFEGQADGLTGSVRIQSNGTNGYEVPDLRFYDTNKLKYTALKAPLSISGNNLNITMPSAMGTAGQILALNTVSGPTFGVDYGELNFYDQPYDLAAQGFGTLSDGDVIMRFVAPRDMEILSSTLGSNVPHTGYAVTAPSGAAAVFDVSTIAVNDTVTPLGTITFADGIQRPTASAFSSTFVFARQVVVITCTTASGIADVGITVGARARAQ